MKNNIKKSLLNHLESDYNKALEKRDITAYLERLSTDAIKWWFNLDIPRIALHFPPLQELSETHAQMPLRLAFILELLEGKISLERIVEFHGLFQDDSDPDATVLAVGAAYQRILDEGRDFSQFSQWQPRAEELLREQSETSPLARAFLLGFMGYATIVAEADPVVADRLFARQLLEIEASGSISLKVYHAAVKSFVFYYRGDLSSAGILIQDVLPLCGDTDCSLVSRLYLQATHGLYHILSGELEMAQLILDETVQHPLFDHVPSSLWLLTQSHRLFAYAYADDKKQTDAIASQIRSWSVPEYNSFYHSYLHYSLGVAAFILQEYRKAHIHAEETVLQGQKCHSRLAQMMAVLLEAQALAGLGKKEQAFSMLEKWFQRWEHKGFAMLASAGALEAAEILASQNRINEAREYLERAKDYLPAGEPLHPVHRTNDFLQQLNLRLLSGDDQTALGWEQHPIRIHTLGDFKIEIGDHIIYDRQWRGGRTKLLLKLLILHGGYKVSATNLADLLWPDADGARGRQNLKIVLWRLRRLGLQKGEEPLHWLQLDNGHISLVRSLCIVDAVVFEQQIKSLLKNDSTNMGELIQVLELYRGDFLTTDVSETQIIEHRERLRQLFINGVIHLSEIVDSDELMEQTLDFLTQARELDPLHEGIHEQLMQLYLKLGFPAKALQSYQHAAKVLMQELGIQPGPVLASLATSIRNKHHS